MLSRPSPSTLAAALVLLLAAPTTTGLLSANTGAALGVVALAGLLAWSRGAAGGVTVTVLAAWCAPALGVALALAGGLLRRSPWPVALAAGLAALCTPAGDDATPFPGSQAQPVLGVALLATASWAWWRPGAGNRRDYKMLAICASGALLALGPAPSPGLPGLALPFAWMGLDGGWAAAAALAVGASALAVARLPARSAWLLAGLVVAEGVGLAVAAPEPRPSPPPPLVRFLGEREGAVLVLPFALCEPPRGDTLGPAVLARADRWRDWLRLAGRGGYAHGGCLHPADPLLGDPVAAAVANVLWPASPVYVPSGVSGRVFRSLGITELLVDRDALDEVRLAALDPVLAKLVGPPQRDVAGRVDGYRLSASGPRGRAEPPYLRPAVGDPPPGWRTLDDVLGGSGRGGIAAPDARRK